MQWYSRVLKNAPQHIPATTGKAEVLERLGRIDESFELLQQIRASGRDTPATVHILATVLRRLKRHKEAIALIEQTLSAGSIPPALRPLLLYELAACYEKLEDYDRAFQALQEANALQPSSFDIDKLRARFEKMREFFTRERIDQMPHAASDSDLPVFIVGMPRSGSTLVEQILASHPKVHGAGEIDEMPARLRDLR